MNNQLTLYHQKSFTNEVEISISNGLIWYKELTLVSKTYLKSPFENIDVDIAFSRVYHLGLLITSLFLGTMSTILIVARWDSGLWTLYLGMILLSIILIGYIYYFLHGIKYGEVAFIVGSTKRYLYMTKNEFWKFKDKLTQINQKDEK